MCNSDTTRGDCTSCGACARLGEALAVAPIDRLYAASRQAMAALYPSKAKAITAGRYDREVELFAADSLAEKGLHNLPHRLADDKLTALLDEHLGGLFEGLSESMVSFYDKKLATAQPR